MPLVEWESDHAKLGMDLHCARLGGWIAEWLDGNARVQIESATGDVVALKLQ